MWGPGFPLGKRQFGGATQLGMPWLACDDIFNMLLLLLLLHPFSGLFSRTTWVSWYQKDKTSLDLNKAREGVVLGRIGISRTIANNSYLAPDG